MQGINEYVANREAHGAPIAAISLGPRGFKTTANAVVVGLFALSFTGCFWVTTKREGDLLRRDVADLSLQVESQEDADNATITKLKQTLEEASALLARNSADLGQEVSDLSNDNARLTGIVLEAKRHTDAIRTEIAQLSAQIASLEERLSRLESGTPTPDSQSADDMYRQAKAAFDKKEYDTASSEFRALVIRYPGHSLAAKAQFYRGESLYLNKNYEQSLGQLQAVFEKYGKSSFADDALFRAGEAAEKLKWCTDARAYFGLLLQKLPKSEFAQKARQRSEQLKKNAKDKKRCES